MIFRRETLFYILYFLTPHFRHKTPKIQISTNTRKPKSANSKNKQKYRTMIGLVLFLARVVLRFDFICWRFCFWLMLFWRKIVTYTHAHTGTNISTQNNLRTQTQVKCVCLIFGAFFRHQGWLQPNIRPKKSGYSSPTSFGTHYCLWNRSNCRVQTIKMLIWFHSHQLLHNTYLRLFKHISSFSACKAMQFTNCYFCLIFCCFYFLLAKYYLSPSNHI